jgi:four helix bundle protein
MQDFKRLVVWHKAHALFLAVHRAAGARFRGTGFSLRAQILDAAASISANIAEGCGKTSTKEFVRFLEIAIGSARELENHLLVARDLELISLDKFSSLNDGLTEVRRMLIALTRSLKEQEARAKKG